MLRVFAIAIFLAAALLFMVQPLSGKVLLPLLGGSPSVWNTCMVFFQAALLLGYFYAHLLTTRVPAKAQAFVHVGLMLGAGLLLPMPIDVGEPGTGDPRVWLLRTLAMTVGLPFFVVSTSGPLLQKWFSRTDDEQAKDPYFLYAASNAGSLVGLLAYPLVVEPMLTRREQSIGWMALYALLVPLVAACAVLAARRPAPAMAPETAVTTGAAPVTNSRRGMWVLLAFVPSSLMLGVTQHLSTDVVSAPLLWVVPLAIYLVTFIVAFSGRVKVSSRGWGAAVPWAVLAVLITTLAVVRQPLVVVVLVHLGAYFVLAMMCHKRLSEDRPDPAHLTEFYLWLSVGGVLGGAFNAILAPVVFASIFEYPIVLMLALLLRPQTIREEAACMPVRRWVWRGVGVVLGIGAFLLIRRIDLAIEDGSLMASGFYKGLKSTGMDDAVTGRVIRGVLPAMVCVPLLFWRGSIRFTGAAGGLLIAGCVVTAGGAIHHERTFFGVHEVASVNQDNWHILMHGTTQHGVQAAKGKLRGLPTMYYHPTGPIGDVIRMLQQENRCSRVGVIGLGVGAIAAYGRPGDSYDFFEIDPAIVRIARNPEFFTYVTDAAAQGVKLQGSEGDGRLAIKGCADATYDLIVVDAFSSDAIPTHLITKEAVELYVSKLKPKGLVAFHISSRYFDLQPVLSRIGQELKLASRVRDDQSISAERAAEAKRPSVWVVMGRTQEDLSMIADSPPRWIKLVKDERFPLWTDDYSNVMGVFSGW